MSQDHPETQGLTRRRLFQVGAAGAAALAAIGALRWIAGGYALLPGEHALGLSKKGLCVARALVEALLPEEPGFPSGLSLGIHQRLDEEAWASPPLLREDLDTALMLIEHAPPLVDYNSRFTRLSLDERVDCFGRMLRARQRLLVAAAASYKQMVYLFYTAHEATWAGMGYAGPFVPEAKPPESSLRYQELLAAARQEAP